MAQMYVVVVMKPCIKANNGCIGIRPTFIRVQFDRQNVVEMLIMIEHTMIHRGRGSEALRNGVFHTDTFFVASVMCLHCFSLNLMQYFHRKYQIFIRNEGLAIYHMICRTSTTPSCNRPISAPKIRRNFYYSHHFSLEKNTLKDQCYNHQSPFISSIRINPQKNKTLPLLVHGGSEM